MIDGAEAGAAFAAIVAELAQVDDATGLDGWFESRGLEPGTATMIGAGILAWVDEDGGEHPGAAVTFALALGLELGRRSS